MVRNICPVCGYLLRVPPINFHICPSCGTEFGYDDAGTSHAELRAIWLRSGAHWWSTTTSAPPNWDPYLQVDNILVGAPVWTTMLRVAAAQDENDAPLGFAASGAGANPQQQPTGSALYGQSSPQRAAA
jgi:hypothetical protein